MGHADDGLLLVCHGPGGTGKGTFLGALQYALGDYSAAAELETFTTKRDAHGPRPTARHGPVARASDGGDLRGGHRRNRGAVEEGYGPGPDHHQKTFEFLPQFTIWIICNHRPSIPGTDSGMRRRVREIPFTTKFKNPTPAIRSTLRDPKVAGPAGLAWLIQGCLDWQRDGVGKLPKQIEKSTADYKLEMDLIADFLEDRCVVTMTEVGCQ